MTQYKRLKRHLQQFLKKCLKRQGIFKKRAGGDFQGLGSQEIKFRFKGKNSTDDSVFWFVLSCFAMF